MLEWLTHALYPKVTRTSFYDSKKNVGVVNTCTLPESHRPKPCWIQVVSETKSGDEYLKQSIEKTPTHKKQKLYMQAVNIDPPSLSKYSKVNWIPQTPEFLNVPVWSQKERK